MEQRFMLSTTTQQLPLFLSYKNTALHSKPKLSAKRLNPHYSFPSLHLERSQLWGQNLVLKQKICTLSDLKKPHLRVEPVRASGTVKWRKERPFDNVIQRDKKLKMVLKIRKILVSRPERVMSLRDLGRFRRELELKKKRRVIALLKKFPAVFEIIEEGAYGLKFKLTAESERLYLEEMRVRNEMEGILVTRLRKLLMMSLDKRILLEKIGHLRSDLGLPFEFRDTICHRYPQYFKVVVTERGPALELTHWDDELAVSAAELAEEDNRAREMEERNLIIDRPQKFNRVLLPKGLKVSKGEMRRICMFRDMPYISPYSDFSELKPGSMAKEKHSVGVVHEILSLTTEKKTLVDHLTHFREEFQFSQQLRGMLIRHPDMFYVSLKGTRNSVFLREAYRDSHLINKDRLTLIKEKLRSLVALSPTRRRRTYQNDADETGEVSEPEDSNSEETGEWLDIDNYMSDEDDEDDDETDWSEDEDAPPDFEEDGETVDLGLSKQIDKADSSKKIQDKELNLVLPDGRLRERW